MRAAAGAVAAQGREEGVPEQEKQGWETELQKLNAEYEGTFAGLRFM